MAGRSSHQKTKREARDISTLYIFHLGNFKLIAKRFAASRTAVSARCAYRAVVWGWVWPSSLLTTCRDSPLVHERNLRRLAVSPSSMAPRNQALVRREG